MSSGKMASLALFAALWINGADGQEFQISQPELDRPGHLRFVFNSDTNSYFILFRGSKVTDIREAVALTLGASGRQTLLQDISSPGVAFFQLRRVPLSSPLDSDLDGIDDLFELRSLLVLNPINPDDAFLDSDGDGSSNLDEYRRGTDPSDGASAPPTTFASSPMSGETGVAVTRETILRFERPLAQGTVLSTNHLFATIGGRRVLSRIELSSDQRTATLFYLENLPASSRVRVTFDGDNVKDALGTPVDADGNGILGGIAQIDFDTLSITPIAGTTVIGRVFASELAPGPDTGTNAINRPLEGVTITVDGAEETLRAVTDKMGNFTLTNSPSGRFFVHIDGRTAMGSQWPNGAYYPVVGKAWDALPGKADNLAGGNGQIYLPLISSNALQIVSAAQDTKVTFPAEIVAANPALAGVEITVPANALFSDNGTRGGSIGIAPVPPDRLPGPLPPGLNFPLVITVQTDGASNFDRPVPVRFPNLPDPVTGVKLGPGEKTALWSFNHDIGEWEIVGSVTVSADGNYAESNAGVGIRQPGWHGLAPGMVFEGGGTCAIHVGHQALVAVQSGLRLNPLCSFTVINGIGWCGAVIVGCVATGFNPWACFFGSVACVSGIAIAVCTCYPEFCGMPSVGGCSTSVAPELQARADMHSPLHEDDGVTEEDLQILRQAYPVLLEIQEILIEAAKRGGGLDEADKHALDRYSVMLDRTPGVGVEGFVAYIIRRSRELSYLLQATSVDSIRSGPKKYVVLRDGQPVLRGQTDMNGRYRVQLRPPEEGLALAFFDPTESTIGFSSLLRNIPTSGRIVTLPDYRLSNSSILNDVDGDGLADVVEVVLGTNVQSSDTDSDGLPDGVEVRQGGDPLDGFPAITGTISSADTPNNAVDICTVNNLAIIADSESGVSVFNVFNGMNPIRIAQVDTPGDARSVACLADTVAVADGPAGLALIDISDPANARITRQISISVLGGGSAGAVAMTGNRAFVGTSEGIVGMVELPSGLLLQRLDFGRPVSDLAIEGETLYVVAGGSGDGGARLLVVAFGDGQMQVAGSTSFSDAGADRAVTGRRRISVGDGIAYVSSRTGFITIDVSDPAQPKWLAGPVFTGQSSFKQIVPNGTGLGVATVGVSALGGSDHDVYLYDTSSPTVTTNFVTLFRTPGIAHAISIYNGLAYVADGTAGLQVINFQSYDNQGRAPSGTLSLSVTNGTITAGDSIGLHVRAQDDAQVRSVEFAVNGRQLSLDGNFPFQTTYRVPTNQVGTNLAFTATIVDTGGNRTTVSNSAVMVEADLIPPGISIESPVGQARFAQYGDLLVRVNASDNVAVDRVVFRLDGAPVAAQRISLSEYLVEPVVSRGEHTLEAEAMDIAGLRTRSLPLQFRIVRQATSREVNVEITPSAQSP